MINNIQQTPTISQHKRTLKSTMSSERNLSNSARVNKNEIKREPAEINFCGFFKPEKVDAFLKNDKFHKVLEMAGGNQALFQASFALVLTCGFRPLSILLMPSKKNKDDQKYASAHSIASGVIGFIITSILLAPFNNGFKKVQTKLKDMIEKGNYLENKKAANTAKTFVGRLTDWIPAIPKGILTIALIPPILKYVFGIEKKKHGSKTPDALTKTDYSLLNFKSKEEANNKILTNAVGGTK